jgi:Uma2 family endonuclease
VDGVLIEKPCGFYKAVLGATLIYLLGNYVEEREVGIVLGAKAPFRLASGHIRLPDISFVAWSRFPNRKLPRGPFLDVPPDLAVEILCASNTRAEMDRKRRDYFAAGVRLVWYVDPDTQTAHVYSAADDGFALGPDGILDGQDVLPGFRLPLEEWFRRTGVQLAERNAEDSHN